MQIRPTLPSFLRGLETTGAEDGLELPAFSTFQNVRLNSGAAAPRPGIQRVLRAAPTQTCANMNGTTDYVRIPYDSRIHILGQNWTVEMAVEIGAVGAVRPILGFDHATDSPIEAYVDASGDLQVTVKTTGGATASLANFAVSEGDKLFLQFSRIGTRFYLRSNILDVAAFASNASYTGDMKTPGGDMLIGKNQAGNFFNGKIEWVRAYSVTWGDGFTFPDGSSVQGPGRKYLKMRHPNPKASYVLWDYILESAGDTLAGKRIEDRSRWGNHGEYLGTLTTAAVLGVQAAPVTMIRERRDWSNRRRLDVIAGGEIYLAEIGT